MVHARRGMKTLDAHGSHANNTVLQCEAASIALLSELQLTSAYTNRLPRPPASELETRIDDLPANPRQAKDADENQEPHRRQLVINSKADAQATRRIARSRKCCLQGLSVPGALEYHFNIHRQEGVDPRTCRETEKSVERASRKHKSRRSDSALDARALHLGGMCRCGSGEYEAHDEESASASASRAAPRSPMVSARQRMGGGLGERTHGTERTAEAAGPYMYPFPSTEMRM
ncbi:hypothetical protein C8R44DRAFT_951993 [Mycena epipterygia]|nr:hypothetical protein C8R44DRAFT_951993 [Mycena epipterygia]